MNLPFDMIIRLSLVIILSIVALRALWMLLKGFMDNAAIGKQEKVDLSSLIEQKKQMLALTQVPLDKEVQEFLSKIQWGDSDIFPALQNKLAQVIRISPPEEQIRMALSPLRQKLDKLTSIKDLSYQNCLNVCSILIFHYLFNRSEELQQQFECIVFRTTESLLENAISHMNLDLSQYIKKDVAKTEAIK